MSRGGPKPTAQCGMGSTGERDQKLDSEMMQYPGTSGILGETHLSELSRSVTLTKGSPCTVLADVHCAIYRHTANRVAFAAAYRRAL